MKMLCPLIYILQRFQHYRNEKRGKKDKTQHLSLAQLNVICQSRHFVENTYFYNIQGIRGQVTPTPNILFSH